MADGIIRQKTGFTVVENYIVDDLNVSLKAKGLYLAIQSKITMPGKNWKKSDFYFRCKEGEKAFESAWKELKTHGYLKTHIYAGDEFKVEYELLSVPQAGAHTYYYDKNGKVKSTNIDRENKKRNEEACNVLEAELLRVSQNGCNDEVHNNNKNCKVKTIKGKKNSISNNTIITKSIKPTIIGVDESLDIEGHPSSGSDPPG